MKKTVRRIVGIMGIVAGLALVVSGCVTYAPQGDTSSATQAGSGGFTVDIDEPSTRGLIQRVTPANFDVTWRYAVSPDESTIVFTGFQSRDSEVADLWSSPVQGGSPTRITSGGTDSVYSPSFTSDGEFIVYEIDGSLWMVRSDGSGGRRKIPGSGVGLDVNPHVSSTDRVVFTSAARDSESFEWRYVIWTSDLDGGSLIQLREGRYPRWSPDGTQIVFEHLGDVWLINADGTGLVQLTATDEIQEGLPAFSTTGNEIVYVSNEGGDFNVWAMDAEGTSSIQLTELTSWDSWPLLTENALYFLSARANDPDAGQDYQRIWRVDRTGQ